MQYPTLFVQDAFIKASGLTSTSTVPAAWEIRGDFGRDEIVRAVQLVVEAHESLRTAIVHNMRSRSFGQRVSAGGPVARYIEFVNLMRSDAEAGMSELMGRLLAHRFDLTSPPLWRGFLAKIGRGRWVLGIAFAHVIVDGASVAVFSRDLANALATGSSPDAPQLGRIAVAERGRRVPEGPARWWAQQYGRRTGLEARWRGSAQYLVEAVPAFSPNQVEGLRGLAADLDVSISTVFGAATAVAAIAVLGCPAPMLGFTTSQRTPENRGVFGPLHDHLPVLGGAPADVTFSQFVHGLHQRRGMAREKRLPCEILERIAKSTPYDIAVSFSPFAVPARHRAVGRGTVTARPILTIGKVDVYRATSVAPVLAAILRPNPDGSVTGDITAISALRKVAEVRALADALAAAAEHAREKPDTPIGELVRRKS